MNSEKTETKSRETPYSDDLDVKYTTKTHISFAFGYFVRSFLFTVFAARVFAFYENEVLLDVTLVMLANIIYGLWNMINDPLLGFISDKPNRFWKRWGRRFPWIISMGLPYCFLIILIFTPPEVNPETHSLFLFVWFLVSICIYDTVYSGWMTNYYALFPDKFRSDKERRKIAAIGSPLGLIATALATLLPPLFIDYGDKSSYVLAMVVMAIISFITFILSIPGSREDSEMIENALQVTKEQQDSFLQAMKVLKNHKNFIAYLIAYLAFHTLTTIMLASIPYIVPFILNETSFYETLLSAGLLIGQLIGIPIWIKFAKKFGNRKLFILGMFWAVASLIPTIFFLGFTDLVIYIVLLGCGLSSIYMGNQLVFSDCIDEIVIDTKKRQEGVFLGIRTFIVRLSIILQSITFWIIHVVSGFDPDSSSQSVEALWGLRIQFALVPLIFLLIAGIVFLLLYNLTPEKVRLNKDKLKELKI